jgi:plasmid maintenance system killer protein
MRAILSGIPLDDWGSTMKLAQFFDQYRLDSLRITPDTDIRGKPVSLVDIHFVPAEGSGSDRYQVAFKLLADATNSGAEDSHLFLRAIGSLPECALELTPAGESLSREQLQQRIDRLINALSSRVAKIHKEQSILHIQPVGKTFLLMDKTRFEVLADDGEGQLSIRIYREGEVNEAGLAANDLLDGLYSGIIKEI